MTLHYQRNGNLVKGIHKLTWVEFVEEFGFNGRRQKLIAGMKRALVALKSCGCKTVYVGGSFVTKKLLPSDTDVLYDKLDFELLYKNYPIFFEFSNQREAMKNEFGGEFFLSTGPASIHPKRELYIDFMQHDKENNPKGIVQIDL